MRIAQIAPLYESVPPKTYGGTERIVAYLADELVRLGHQVSVFASGDSCPAGELFPCSEQGIRLETELISDVAEHMSMLQRVRDMQGEFDLIHFHTDLLHMPFFNSVPEKTLTTLHGRLDMKGLEKVYTRFSRFPLVSISHNQRKPLPAANWIANIYHGVPANTYHYSPPGKQSYLAFLGRFSPEKGAHHAIDIAFESDIPLRMAAKICRQLHTNEAYYENVIRPRLDQPHVEYIGEITEQEKSDFLGGAIALLMPISWPEPFGLVMIEAMACGTPVIAFKHGSTAEIIEDGVTGFLVETPAEAVDAVSKLDRLDRREIRKRFEERFSAPVMAKRYSNLYMKALGQIDANIAASAFSDNSASFNKAENLRGRGVL